MKGMTASNPANGQPTTPQCSMAFECFDRIRRTSGKVAAGCGKQRRKGHLVEPNESNKNGAHSQVRKRRASSALCTSSSASWENEIPKVLGRTRITASTGGRVPNTRVRTISRSRRLRRFRSAAECRPGMTGGGARIRTSRSDRADQRHSRWTVDRPGSATELIQVIDAFFRFVRDSDVTALDGAMSSLWISRKQIAVGLGVRTLDRASQYWCGEAA